MCLFCSDGRLPTGVVVGGSGGAAGVIDLAITLGARKGRALGHIARGNNVIAVGIAPEALRILRPFARAVVIQHVAAVIGLTAPVVVIDTRRARQARSVRVGRGRRVGRSVTGVVVRSLGGLGSLRLGCGGLERFALGILKRSAQLIELGRLRVDLPIVNRLPAPSIQPCSTARSSSVA